MIEIGYLLIDFKIAKTKNSTKTKQKYIIEIGYLLIEYNKMNDCKITIAHFTLKLQH